MNKLFNSFLIYRTELTFPIHYDYHIHINLCVLRMFIDSIDEAYFHKCNTDF